MLATCETDSYAIITYAAIHNGLTMELVNNYADYPSREQMAKELSDMHIGYDFMKDKAYDWDKVARSKDNKQWLKSVWLACKLNKNVGDITRVNEFPQSDVFTFSFPCFTVDTKIVTTEGLKNINEVKVGDKVVVTKPVITSNKEHLVENVFDNGERDVFDILFDDGFKVSCTFDHKFLIRDQESIIRWKEANKLTIKDEIICDTGNSYRHICSFNNIRRERVYDITVKNIHMFKLENEILVSNCCDLSIAGQQKGMIEGETRSGLVYEVLRILKNMKELNTLPTLLILENVDALVNKKNKPQFEELNKEFKSIGYNCQYKVLNTKFTGIPQNRARVFGVYYLDSVDMTKFEFPHEFDNGVRLVDVLEDEVDDKYYINNEKAQALIKELILNGTLVDLENEGNTEDSDDVTGSECACSC